MGHKRKKFTERKAERESLGFNESPLKKKMSSDTPKAFARIMIKKQQIEKRAQEVKTSKDANVQLPSLKNKDEDLGIDPKAKKNNANNYSDQKKQATEELRIKPGEKMSEFSRRVDEHMRDKMHQSAKSHTAEGTKKKKYFEKLKAKKKNAKLKAEEDKAFDAYERLQDQVRLNDVAQAPPTLTAIPKKRRNDEILANKKWKNTPGEEDYDDLVPDDIKRKTDKEDDGPPAKKTRLRNMTPAGRRILEAERKQAIENYRLVKQRKLLEGGRQFPEHVGNDKEEDDDEY